MLQTGSYGQSGELLDEHGRVFRRVVDWLEPEEAEQFVASGVPYMVEWCQEDPVRGRPERFRRDVLRAMITRQKARRYMGRKTVPTVMVGELWRSADFGDCLLFVEQGPHSR